MSAWLKKMLAQWGLGFDEVIHTDSENIRHWRYDSMTFLTKNSCIVGFMIQHSETNWRGIRCRDDEWELQSTENEWERIYKHEIIEKIMKYNCKAYLVWKQWVPLSRWINSEQPFHVRNDSTEPSVRWEYEPTSCWLPQRINYDGKDKTVAKMIKKWATPCMLSNAKQFIMLSPRKDGWVSENIMEFDGLPVGTVADRLSGLITSQLENYIERHPQKKKEIMPYMAHALMTVATRFNIKINFKGLSAFKFEDDEEEKLKEYEESVINQLNESI